MWGQWWCGGGVLEGGRACSLQEGQKESGTWQQALVAIWDVSVDRFTCIRHCA